MNTTRIILGLLWTGGLAGCAHTEPAPVVVEAPATSNSDWPLSMQGVITMDEIRPRSDIVILPPAVEHVVWVRGIDTSRFDGVEVGSREAPPLGKAGAMEPMGSPREVELQEWPLLAEASNFDSEIGRVRMCLEDGALRPCDKPEHYRCEGNAAGGYCVEVGK